MEVASWYRSLLIVLTGVVLLVMLVQSIRAWRHLSPGQKLWVTGAFLMMLYVSDAAREAVVVDLGFRWRLVFWNLGLVAYFAYYLEPSRSKFRRFGNPRVTDPPRDEPL